jgi:signal transduction histidine kinase
MKKPAFPPAEPTGADDRNNLREEPTKERSLLWISAFVVAAALAAFALVSLPALFLGTTHFHEVALIVLLGFLLGMAVYHILVSVYDREGAIYPIFIAEIFAFCLHLFAEGAAWRGVILPDEAISQSAIHICAIAALIVGAALVAVFSVRMLRPHHEQLNGGDRLYVCSLILGGALMAFCFLPIPAIDALFVPQVLPVTFVVLVQSVMVEAYDEHYLATRYFAVYKRQQELTAQNEALATLDRQRREMMATLSHETRTPLAVVSGYIGLMAMEMRAEGVSEQRARDLDMVTDSIQVIAELMKNYEDLANTSDTAERVPVSVVEVITRVSTLYRHILEQAGMALTMNIPGSLPKVQVQPGRLTQVLLNLMKNAAKHSHGKTVTIAVQPMGNHLTIIIADDGDGIAPSILPNVFERGVTGECGGAGIGLAICKEIVEAEGGRIEIESQPGKGTSVTFTLPIHNSQCIMYNEGTENT